MALPNLAGLSILPTRRLIYLGKTNKESSTLMSFFKCNCQKTLVRVFPLTSKYNSYYACSLLDLDMSLHNLIYLVVGFLVLVTPLVGVVENVQEVLAQEQEQEQEQQQQNASSSNATTSITQGLLQNSTSFGQIGSDTAIKHPPELSTLTVQPWPVVKPNENFTVSGKAVDKVTLDPIINENISFFYESASQSIPADSLTEIQPQKTDPMGKFRVDVQAPSTEGATSITAVFNGTGLHHAASSSPAIVIVSNTTTGTTGASPTTANTTTQASEGE